MTKTAFITGITGQDGSYLTELLLAHGYIVHGLVRRNSNTVRSRIDHLMRDESIYGQKLFLHYGDLDDTTTIRRILAKTRPDEVYHLAGQSHVGASFEIPESTCEFTAMGTLRFLEILRDCDPRPKFVHASSSEIFGEPDEAPQNEDTPMRPMTPYGVAKAFATQMVRVYREKLGLFACNMICYNHESPRRGESFVTRKITRSAARIKAGKQSKLSLGNIDGQRDRGNVPHYVKGFHTGLPHSMPGDYVSRILFRSFAANRRAYLRSWPITKPPRDIEPCWSKCTKPSRHDWGIHQLSHSVAHCIHLVEAIR